MRWMHTPGFALGITITAVAASADPEAIAESFFKNMPGDASAPLDPVLLSKYTSASTGVTHLSYRQTIDGIRVFSGDILINIGKDGEILNWHGTPGGRIIRTKARHEKAPSLVLEKAARAVGLPEKNHGPQIANPAAAGLADGVKHKTMFGGGELSADPIPVEPVWARKDNGELVRAWHVLIRTKDLKHGFDVLIADGTGESLKIRDRMKHASYKAVPLPMENPDEGVPVVIADPADPVASPFGWHDINGIPGAEFTDTRGNNVFAQEDSNGDDAGGFRPAGGSGLNFTFAGTTELTAPVLREAAIISLFYLSNKCHDILYRYGFNEGAGNFQENNYARGGLAKDAVRADTEEENANGNAFFFPTVEGKAPIMEFGTQSFVLEGLRLLEPGPARDLSARAAEFGGKTQTSGISGFVVQGTDQANATGPSTTDCCTALTNAAQVKGKIALIDRGSCDFTIKVKNAQNAGAIGVIMVNNAGDDLVLMGGQDSTLTIPSLFIGQSDGDALRAFLNSGVNVRVRLLSHLTKISTARDSTIVIHEYSHGLSTRLTGGPRAEPALDGVVPGGLGEGWSDFVALALTSGPDDGPLTPRAIGEYAFFTNIRRFPYSTSMSVNPLTYADIKTNQEIHAVGEVWCSMLWDVYWDLAKAYGRADDIRSPFTAGGDNLAIQLVIDGMKLQPAVPSFTQARDAILLADRQISKGKNQFIIWNAFAKRGLGVGATMGGNPDDVAIKESFLVPPELESADDDQDGISNLLEAALGSNPNRPDPALHPTAGTVRIRGQLYPTFQYRRIAGAADSTAGFLYEVEVSEDLRGFSSQAGQLQTASVTPLAGENIEKIVVRTTTPLPTGKPKQFFRLKVSRQNPTVSQ